MRTSIFKFVRTAARVASDKLGQNILALDVRGLTALTDCFLFIGATSHLHVKALEDTIRETLREKDIPLLRTDGIRGHTWRVLDYGSFIIHIMDQKTRDFYAIERLWNQAKKLALRERPLKRGVRSVARKPRVKAAN
ncbi:MAG: ribosome silencing factor [Elusimicrobia bacterium]|nr:ribosome silencing factor [Candidatus Obscuribacterium magneticum]